MDLQPGSQSFIRDGLTVRRDCALHPKREERVRQMDKERGGEGRKRERDREP